MNFEPIQIFENCHNKQDMKRMVSVVKCLWSILNGFASGHALNLWMNWTKGVDGCCALCNQHSTGYQHVKSTSLRAIVAQNVWFMPGPRWKPFSPSKIYTMFRTTFYTAYPHTFVRSFIHSFMLRFLQHLYSKVQQLYHWDNHLFSVFV